jgi:hypothetical protein
MGRRYDKSLLVDFLLLVMAGSLVAVALLLLIAAIVQSLSGVLAQLVLTFVGLLLGSLLMQVQLRARRRAGPGRTSLLFVLGLVVIGVSQVSFLILVWTGWRESPTAWRVWWLSMVPSVFVTHMILLRAVAARRGGLAELVTFFCALWVGLMLLWLGLRERMLSDISPAYLWVGALPAAGTVVGTIYVVLRRMLRLSRPGAMGKRFASAGMVASHLVVAVAAFYIGRATAGRSGEVDEDPNAFVRAAGGDVGRQLGKDKYRIQARVAEYLGDTRIVSRQPFITVNQIDRLQPRLRPGDILLERRNWYLSNPFLPGFWPHSALYVGEPDDLRRLGIDGHPSVRRHLAAYVTRGPDGRTNTVVEAVSEGVIFNSLTHSMQADYVVVLRPRLSERQIATAIVKAFEHVGKPYDFNFDFDDRQRIVCTQLVWLAYEGLLDLPLKRVLGRNTLPANEIARKYVAERADPKRQLDVVMFLDAIPDKGIAREAPETEFCRSVDRPRALVER